MKFLFRGSIFLILGLPLLSATHFLEIDTTHLLQCTLSSRHHNRIAISGKRIKKFIYPEGFIAIRQEEESGQIFVQSLVDYPPITTLSIVTEDGVVQDLELHFEDCRAELIVLQEPETCPSICLEEACIELPNYGLEKLIDGALSGRLPEGYISFECDRRAKRLKKGVCLRRVSKFIGDSSSVFLLSIENNSKSKQAINECELSFMGGDWVYIQKTALNPGEKMIALVGRGTP